MDLGKRVAAWPVLRQLRTGDRLGLGEAVKSDSSAALRPRTEDADAVVDSICPFCAVGCAQRIFVKDDEILHIEGDPASPISRGRLCPRGSSTKDLVTSDRREYTVRYRRPGAAEWENLDLDTAMDMIADRIIATRDDTWQELDENRHRVNRTLGFGTLGGAALDNEENYLIKKLFTALGAVQIENQARI
ncbi:MAG: dehydrogenase [Nitriliruptorales bacterium]|nr:dehydrogenase [Nitriliruptorales bacterium]